MELSERLTRPPALRFKWHLENQNHKTGRTGLPLHRALRDSDECPRGANMVKVTHVKQYFIEHSVLSISSIYKNGLIHLSEIWLLDIQFFWCHQNYLRGAALTGQSLQMVSALLITEKFRSYCRMSCLGRNFSLPVQGLLPSTELILCLWTDNNLSCAVEITPCSLLKYASVNKQRISQINNAILF